ncbi:MAG: hypothetical protein U9N86_13460 [Bacteroidota bacterium]|nr:hypothetical protein [Bacteroidota bacterium]
MNKSIIAGFMMILFGLTACFDPIDEDVDIISHDDNYGQVEITFNFTTSGIPPNRIKRADLSLASSADSVFTDQFFVSTNVSDQVSKYTFELRPGTYYYRATIVCLCGGDSCKYAGFSGQNAIKQTASKFEIEKGQKTYIHTQFH